jgi:type II secretory pathway component GspD/PulD (secretin)
VFRLKHLAADQVAKGVLTAYTDAEGKALGKDLAVDSDPRTNSLVVAGTPDQIQAIEQFITKIDVPPGEMYEVIPLKNANAEDVAKVLNEVFNGPDGKGKRVAVVAEKKTNAVVVTKASAADLKTIKELVKNAVDVKGVGAGR